jgi:hypothetical protein
MACQWLITYQTKVLTTWFLNLPLDESIDNKKTQSLKFESKTPWSTTRRPKSQEKLKKGYLEEGTTTRPTKAQKVANQAKLQRRAKKSSKPKQNEQEKLKLKKTQNSPWNKLPLINSMQVLPLR